MKLVPGMSYKAEGSFVTMTYIPKDYMPFVAIAALISRSPFIVFPVIILVLLIRYDNYKMSRKYLILAGISLAVVPGKLAFYLVLIGVFLAPYLVNMKGKKSIFIPMIAVDISLLSWAILG